MVKHTRKRVGLVYSHNENWIAGSYYILNCIQGLMTLPDNEKPYLFIFTDILTNFNKIRNETNYPYLEFINFPPKANYNFLEKVINKFGKRILNKRILRKKPNIPVLDLLYPNQTRFIDNKGLKKVNWIPDFQEEFLPQFFSNEEILKRKKYQKEILYYSDIVVFSSSDTQNHFQKLYPKSPAQQFVLPFAVKHPEYSKWNITELRIKFNLSKDYFFTPNQFWAHKNHQVLLDAVLKAKEKGDNIIIAFSGKEHDYRNKGHFDSLKRFVYDNNIDRNIKFLGFLDRREQLMLMKHATAIIQPSLFEGWSTVVEDAKAMGKHIVLSNLSVHKEQIDEGVTFFDPSNSNKLCDILCHIKDEKELVGYQNYEDNLKKFGVRFMELVALTQK